MGSRLAVATGVTSGIGHQVALGLVRQGYDLVVIARNPSKVDALRLEAQAIRSDANVEAHIADLSLVGSTQAAVSAIRERVDRIDLLFLSAGRVPNSLELTSEGIESTFAISYLSRVVITEGLLPALMRSEDKLLVVVASPGMNGNVDVDDINFQKRGYSTMKVLGQFQHANDVYFTQLDADHAQAGLRTFVYEPGVVDTPIHDNWPTPLRLMMRYAMWPWTISAERSASIPLEVVAGTLEPTSHLFNSRRRSLDTPRTVRNADYRQRVVAFSRELISGAAPQG